MNKPTNSRIKCYAAAKSKGVSLNDQLLKGPDDMPSLLEILFRFKEKSVASSGNYPSNNGDRSRSSCVKIPMIKCQQEKEGLEEFILRVLTFGSQRMNTK